SRDWSSDVCSSDLYQPRDEFNEWVKELVPVLPPPVEESLPRRTNCLIPKPLELWPELFVPYPVDLFTRFDERWRESIHNPLPEPLQGVPHRLRDSQYLRP